MPKRKPTPETRQKRQEAKERRAAAQRLRIEALAKEAQRRAEEAAEEQAPAQQRRNGVAVPDLKRGGYRRVDPLQAMHDQDARLVTRLHLHAARKFAGDYEMGVEGASGSRTEAVQGGSTPGGPTEARLAALGRYRGACDALGPSLRSVVQLAALHRKTLAQIGEVIGIRDRTRVSGYLVAGLDRLVDHYLPEGRRETVVTPFVDAAVRDVPQERLGRVAA